VSGDSSKADLPLRAELLESARIRSVFEKRVELSEGPLDLYGLYAHVERQLALVRFFRRIGLCSLAGLRILDVGCGSGGHLRRLVDYGAEPGRCFGVDLFRPSLTRGHALNPSVSFLEASGASLPFLDGSFDLIFQSTVFSSVLGEELHRKMADEIHRVLRPGGYFIWYDFAYSNPQNPNVQGIAPGKLRRLLEGFELEFQRVTLAPPLGRPSARISATLYRLLSALPFLRTHYFCFARKSGSGSGPSSGALQGSKLTKES
jgi:SAM-dependent methyltransferase